MLKYRTRSISKVMQLSNSPLLSCDSDAKQNGKESAIFLLQLKRGNIKNCKLSPWKQNTSLAFKDKMFFFKKSLCRTALATSLF